ncbi:Hypothetical protein, putative [Bodo saltans]|uniref:C2 domain-containing protein n=1 Tax=Bodo saltans TaxID=75058 RepID=A0A0S4JAK2_BODSA|nr:Hypothetical protein, putative [Bodo saltans]|eukprot:CUG88486.1 Hypothetical protein, putative [Bodo saltans]
MTCHSALGLTTGLMEANSYHLEVGFVDANSTQKTAQHSEYSGVCNLNDQKFTMTVHDNTAVVGFWLYRDDLQRKKLIGQRTFTMSELMEGEKNNITLPLLHPKGRDCPAKIRLSTKFSAFAGDKHQQSGVFAPESDGTRGPDSPPRGPPQRSSSGTIHRPPLHRHASSSALTPRQGSAPGASKSTTGLLFVRVENCKNLRNFEVVGTSDPYVVISIGDKTIKTQMVPNCLNPVFNFDAEVEIEDPTHAVAEIKVFDENVTKDILMGKTTIPLIDVIRSKGQLAKETRNLSPQGTITVTLTLRMES